MRDMSLPDPTSSLLYVRTAETIRRMVWQGLFRAGDRVPSIRALSKRLRVGINTVKQAYALLEDARVIQGRAGSGFYVPARLHGQEGGYSQDPPVASAVKLSDEHRATVGVLSDGRLIPLGQGSPNPELLPALKLGRMLAGQVRKQPSAATAYPEPNGDRRLRTQIAKRSLDYGCAFSVDDIVVTAGCVEAVSLALQAVCRPGDTVAVESPVYYTFLNLLRLLGLKILEVPASPEGGVSLEVLQYALSKNPVQACLLISSFNNPLGSLMSIEKGREVVRTLGKLDIPLIEDDVYGDVGFGHERPHVLKKYDDKGLVLLCSSFSKTLAPGYRVGWIAAGRFQSKVQELKALFNVATATPTQLAVAEFLANGGYDRHLRTIRRRVADSAKNVRQAVVDAFPPGTCVAHPSGGYVTWVALPEGFDAGRLAKRAAESGIGIAPGHLFSLGASFDHCLRVNHSYWSRDIRVAIERLGVMAETCQRPSRSLSR